MHKAGKVENLGGLRVTDVVFDVSLCCIRRLRVRTAPLCARNQKIMASVLRDLRGRIIKAGAIEEE